MRFHVHDEDDRIRLYGANPKTLNKIATIFEESKAEPLRVGTPQKIESGGWEMDIYFPENGDLYIADDILSALYAIIELEG